MIETLATCPMTATRVLCYSIGNLGPDTESLIIPKQRREVCCADGQEGISFICVIAMATVLWRAELSGMLQS
jgi:hypothetical protein